ncbi:hypothetical protein ABUK73_17870 [Agrobacterium sp. BA1120]|uniref:hypothetical protein n=1 Tax=Agrobacterium sp. BA1120 TaxID=3228927 RepID=UPI00336ACAAE
MKKKFEELDSAAVEDFRAKLDAALPVGVSTVEVFYVSFHLPMNSIWKCGWSAFS